MRSTWCGFLLAVGFTHGLFNMMAGCTLQPDRDLTDPDAPRVLAVDADAKMADGVLKPDFAHWVSLSREFRGRAIHAGCRETLAQAGALRALHAV